MRIAWIGLGAMGARLARRLADAGHELTVWNRTSGRADGIAARIAATPRDAAASADVVVTMVADPEALVAVSEGPDGIAAGIGAEATVVEMSTVGPEAVRRLAAALPAGAGLLDAPVLGSLAEAEAGTLRLFVGGDEPLFERYRALLAELGESVHVGPLGSGAAAKLVANAALLGVVALLGETLALADALGLPRERAYDVLAATPLAAQAERRRPALESGDFPPRFPLRLARKDAELIDDAAGSRLAILESVRRVLADAEAAGLADADYTAVLSHLTRRA